MALRHWKMEIQANKNDESIQLNTWEYGNNCGTMSKQCMMDLGATSGGPQCFRSPQW